LIRTRVHLSLPVDIDTHRIPARPARDEPDHWHFDMRFVFGYTPLEFRDSLYMLADGKLNAAPLITGKVGLHGVAAAFDALGDPETHAKILIDPRSDATAP
jgi:threonine dehydrogenase-like Zn-dependent dehydrogenase